MSGKEKFLKDNNFWEWLWYFFGLIILLWGLMISTSPLSYASIYFIAIIIIMFSGVRASFLILRVFLKKPIDKYRIIRPILCILISSFIIFRWTYFNNDMESYIFEQAALLKEKCEQKYSCLNQIDSGEGKWNERNDDFLEKNLYYNNGLHWRIRYQADKSNFILAMYTALDGPYFAVCGGVNAKLERHVNHGDHVTAK